MHDEGTVEWPLPPRHAAHTLHGLAVAMNDVLRNINGELTDRDLEKMNSISESAELIACELVHFFATRPDDDHQRLEEICKRYLAADRT